VSLVLIIPRTGYYTTSCRFLSRSREVHFGKQPWPKLEKSHNKYLEAILLHLANCMIVLCLGNLTMVAFGLDILDPKVIDGLYKEIDHEREGLQSSLPLKGLNL
jgi:hypothetical protein